MMRDEADITPEVLERGEMSPDIKKLIEKQDELEGRILLIETRLGIVNVRNRDRAEIEVHDAP